MMINYSSNGWAMPATAEKRPIDIDIIDVANSDPAYLRENFTAESMQECVELIGNAANEQMPQSILKLAFTGAYNMIKAIGE